jgi:predicted ATPase
MDPQLKRQRTFDALTRVLLRESLHQPLLLLIEDLHWLDSETDAWLHLLSERLATVRLLLLVNYRPEYQHAWGSKTYYTQLRLDPLGPAEAQELLTALVGEDSGAHGGAALQALKHRILDKTEGNPFFIEEIVQGLVEQGVLVREGAGGEPPPVARLARSLAEIQLPATVQAVLTARIDRLPATEKALLQTLAVLGKTFSWSLLARVMAQPEEELLGRLAHLRAAEFIYEQPAFPESAYTFKHALTQEVAYNSLLLERRLTLHERTAQALEVLYADRLAEHYEALAHHYSRSGNTPKAVDYLQRAGQQAAQRSAYAEAIERLTAALELLETLPKSRERLQQELLIQTTLSPVLSVAKGYAAPEVERSYTRARALCQLVEDTLQLGPVLWGLHRFYLMRAEHRTAQELAEQLLRLSQPTPASPLFLAAHTGLACALVSQGALIAARGDLLQDFPLSNAQERRALAFRYGMDPGVLRHGWAAFALWTLGYPEAALQQSQAMLTLAQELAHPYSVAAALVSAARVQQCRRDIPGTQAWAEAALTLATEQGFPYFMAFGAIHRGWALAMQGQVEEGLAQMRQGLAAYRATGAELFRPIWLALLAESYGHASQGDEGLRAVAEALAVVDVTGERWWEAELHRLQGELLLQSGVPRPESCVCTPHTAEAEACFEQAIDVARRQQAKSFELRTALSLARLWQQQGKQAEAQALLAPIYGWFTEGFDTADLQDAKALLEELAG